jgi:hypothetical protein
MSRLVFKCSKSLVGPALPGFGLVDFEIKFNARGAKEVRRKLG